MWTTSVAQPVPGNVDRSSLIITFFTNFWVTGVLCTFRLVPGEAVTSKDIPDPSRFDFWKGFQEIMLPYQMQKAIPQGNLIEDVWFWTMCSFFQNTVRNSVRVTWSKFQGSVLVFCFISVSKPGNFKNHFATMNSLPECSFRHRRCVFLVGTKEVMDYGSNKRGLKPWRWITMDVIFIMRNIEINLTWTHQKNSAAAIEAPSLNIPFHWNISQTNMKATPISTKTIISCAMKKGIAFWVWRKVNGNRDRKNKY